MKRSVISSAFVVCVLAASLTSCNATPGTEAVDTSLTVQEAKATAMRMETDLAEFVPAEVVASIDQRQTGVLMSCSGERTYQWTGQTKVAYRTPEAIDPDALVNEIISTYADHPGFTARSEPFPDGQPGVQVIGEYGAGYLVNENVERTGVEILSFSPCFVLPEEMWPGDHY